jgi:ABC-type dipeptide/oligopeptide/nickel transport system permease component
VSSMQSLLSIVPLHLDKYPTLIDSFRKAFRADARLHPSSIVVDDSIIVFGLCHYFFHYSTAAWGLLRHYAGRYRPAGGSQDAQIFQVLRERYGLDQPIHIQYLRWVAGWPQGDFGWSLGWNSPVWPLVRDRLAYTVLLGAASLLITLTYAIPVGIYSATHQYSIGDNLLSLGGFLGLSLPGFLLALFWMFLGR